MADVWLMLMPRELEAIQQPANDAGNGPLLREVQAGLDVATGELLISRGNLARSLIARRNWGAGHESAFRAILEAADRHGEL